MRRLLALVLILACAPIADAHAESIKRWPFAMPTTDGQHTAAWSDSDGAVHVLTDTAVRDHVIATVPAHHCSAAAALAADRLAFMCAWAFREAPVRLLEIASGQWSTISDEQPIVDAMDQLGPEDDGYHIAGLGSHDIQLDSLNRAGTKTRVFSLETGQQVALPQGVRQTVDLNAPGGIAHICAPLRVSRYSFNNYGGVDWLPEPVAYRRPLLVTLTARLLLERCGSRAVHDLGPSASVPIVTKRYIAWSDYQSRLHVRDRATGRTRRWTMPVNGAGPRLVGTEHRIWVDDTSTLGRPLIAYVNVGSQCAVASGWWSESAALRTAPGSSARVAREKDPGPCGAATPAEGARNGR